MLHEVALTARRARHRACYFCLARELPPRLHSRHRSSARGQHDAPLSTARDAAGSYSEPRDLDQAIHVQPRKHPNTVATVPCPTQPASEASIAEPPPIVADTTPDNGSVTDRCPNAHDKNQSGGPHHRPLICADRAASDSRPLARPTPPGCRRWRSARRAGSTSGASSAA